MVLSEPPYPLPPRHAPADLGRTLRGSHVGALVRLAALFSGLAGFLLLPCVAFAGAAAFLFVLEESSFILQLTGYTVCTVFGMVGLKAWLPRRQALPPTATPSTDQHLALAFIHRVAEEIGAPAPTTLYLDSGTALRCDARMSVWRLWRGPRWEIHLGLWLWQSINLSEFKALVARTLAPLSRGRLERLRISCGLLLDGFISGEDAIDELARTLERGSGFARVVRGCFRGISFPALLLAKVGRWCSRVPDLELANDLVGVRVSGSDSLVHAVFHTDVAELLLNKLDEELRACRREGVCTSDLYDHRSEALQIVRDTFKDDTLGELPSLRGAHAGKYVDVFELNQDYRSELWKGFPNPSMREAYAKRDFVLVEIDDRPAKQLLQNLPGLRERFTRAHYQEWLNANPNMLAFPPDVLRRWLAISPEPRAPKYGGLYDEGRLLEPGTRQEREAALLRDSWDDAQLLSNTATLYVRVAPVVQRWQTARKSLRKLLRKTLYRPTRRDRDRVDDLDDERIKTGKWLAAIDQRVFVLHVHMAARLGDLQLHEELLERYRSVLRFQVFVADAREFRDRTAAFSERMSESEFPPYTLRRDAAREFTNSRKDFEGYISDVARLNDPLLTGFIDQVPLDQFLFAHKGEVSFRGDRAGRRLTKAWEEVARKADWLHYLNIRALLELHEKIVQTFAAQANIPIAEMAREAMVEVVDDELTLGD